eukprot:1759660-Rhodomonas_salina.1
MLGNEHLEAVRQRALQPRVARPHQHLDEVVERNLEPAVVGVGLDEIVGRIVLRERLLVLVV